MSAARRDVEDGSFAPEATPPARERAVAFLGCGAAADLHARTLSRVAPELPLHFASRSAERARAAAAAHRGADWCEGYEAALRDPRVSTALVLTPPAHHLEWTLAAIEAGKDVIVEKPAFPRSADFDRVTRAAASAARRVLVAENYAYKPLLGHLRRLLREEMLGRTLFLHVNALKRQSSEGWRSDPARSGGGALLEGGIHWISLLARLGPDVERVRAASPDRKADHAERSTHVVLEYENGMLAALSYSWDAHAPLGGLRISRAYGTHGSAVFESNGLFLAAFGRRRLVRFGARDLLGYAAMFRDFLDALHTGRQPTFTLAHARRDVELVEEAYRSAGLEAPGTSVDAPDVASSRPNVREGEKTPWNG